jgi:hypothetical protein
VSATHDAGGVTGKDIALATAMDKPAGEVPTYSRHVLISRGLACVYLSMTLTSAEQGLMDWSMIKLS